METGPSLEFRGSARYETRRLLGEGGMGTVYEAFDRESETVVALKVLRWFDPQLRMRFKREFRAVQGLEHPNLVRLGELVEEAGTLFYTMELIDGVDFLEYVRPEESRATSHTATTVVEPLTRGSRKSTSAPTPDGHDQPGSTPQEGGYDEEKLRAVLRQLALGLTALHTDGTLHRDLKPSNIIVERSGRVVILDFGVALPTFEKRMTRDAGALGTAFYMAPEQAIEKELGPSADWYSVGVMLYEALTGRLPFAGLSLEVMLEKQRREPAPPRAWVPSVHADLDALCVDLLRTNPALRPAPAKILERLAVAPEDAALAASRPPSVLEHRAPRYGMSMPFVGRREELDELRRAYDDARDHAVTVIVHGQTGMGKSELVREFTRQLADDGAQSLVLAGRCYERESLPYKAVDGVIDALSNFLAGLPSAEARALVPARGGLLRNLFPVLQRVEAVATARLENAAAADPLERRANMFGALRDLFARIADERRVVIVIDDLQWTDADSLYLLADLLLPPDAPRVLLIATVRTSIADELPANVVAGTAEMFGDLRRLNIGRLSESSARELVEELAPDTAHAFPDTIDAIVTEAHGHPMFLLELSRYVETRAINELAVRLEDALWSGITALPSEARAMLEAVCVAGSPIAQGVVAQATEQDGATWPRSASILRVEHLARTSGGRPSDAIEPYHDRVRDAVTSRLDPAEHRRLHERLAVALESAGAADTSPDALVRHLVAIGEMDRAARNAQRGAEVAGRALAFDHAAQLYETTLRLGEPSYAPGEARDVRLRLAEALANAGRAAEAGETYLAAAAGADDPDMQLSCRRHAAEQFLISGHIQRGLDSLDAVLRYFGVSLPSSPRRALVSLLWHRLKLWLRGRRWTRRREQQIAPDDLVRFDVYRSVAQGLGAVDSIRGMDFQVRAMLLALRLGEPTRVAAAMAYEAIFYSAEGGRRIPKARARLDEAHAIAEGAGSPPLDAWLAMAESMLSMCAGRFGDGVDQLELAEQKLRDQAGATWELNNARLFRLQLLRFMGRFTELRSEFTRLARVAVRRGDRYMETSMNRSHSFLWLVSDQPDEARRVLEATTWVPPEGIFHLQHWYALRARSEIALYEGNAAARLDQLSADFTALGRSLLTRIQFTRALARWVHGRVLLAAGVATGVDAPIREVGRIVGKLERERIGYARTWARLLGAGVAMQTRNREAAVVSLRAAIDEGSDHEMALEVAAARCRLAAIVGGDEAERLEASADAWMSSEGIRNPSRMVETICPGCAPAR